VGYLGLWWIDLRNLHERPWLVLDKGGRRAAQLAALTQDGRLDVENGGAPNRVVQSEHYLNEKIAVLQYCKVLESMIDEDMPEIQI
jgi:hypothetical protein